MNKIKNALREAFRFEIDPGLKEAFRDIKTAIHDFFFRECEAEKKYLREDDLDYARKAWRRVDEEQKKIQDLAWRWNKRELEIDKILLGNKEYIASLIRDLESLIVKNETPAPPEDSADLARYFHFYFHADPDYPKERPALHGNVLKTLRILRSSL